MWVSDIMSTRRGKASCTAQSMTDAYSRLIVG
jgi:hypothetical protein